MKDNIVTDLDPDMSKFKMEKDRWYYFPLTFWELVDQLNWKENCKSNLNILMKKFETLCEDNVYIMDYFDNCRNSFKIILQCTLEDYALKQYGNRCSPDFFNGGDDSWDDFTNHIIGLGKEVYFSVLNNPENAKKYMDDYVESFAYCFLLKNKKYSI